MPGKNEQEKTRRLATIMAADIVGYSRLMDADEEGTYAALLSARSEIIEPKIKKHKARIVKHTGDGFLAEFPTVLSAVKFAMQLQQEMGRRAMDIPDNLKVKFRIGINLGDIIVDDTGDIFGDGVNVAARLEGLGIPGGICISGSVYEAVHKKLKVKFDDLGGQKVKNISGEVHTYDIRWSGEAGKPEERKIKTSSMGMKPIFAAAGLMIILIGAYLVWRGGYDVKIIDTEFAASMQSIAVLPFEDNSQAGDQAYFSDGVAEEILNLLTRVEGLEVAARTRSFKFRGDEMELDDIGSSLGVRHVLAGTLRKQGERVRISAQLMDAELGTQLWAESYDRDLEDIFAVQDEIAAAIASELEIQLLGSGGEIVTSEVMDPVIYEVFLEARYKLRRRNPVDMASAFDLLNQVLEAEPNYARAHVAISEVYNLGSGGAFSGMFSTEEADRNIQFHTDRARELDPNLGEIYPILALRAMRDGRALESLGHFDMAISLLPNESRPYHWKALLLAQAGYLDHALKANNEAARLAPENANVFGWRGWIYQTIGDLDKAREDAEAQVRLGNASGGYSLANIDLMEGDFEAARQHLATFTSLFELDPAYGEFLITAYQDSENLESFLVYLDNNSDQVERFQVIMGLYALRQWDRLIPYLQSPLLVPPLMWSEEAAELRADPRFMEIMESRGYFDLWKELGPPPGCAESEDGYNCK